MNTNTINNFIDLAQRMAHISGDIIRPSYRHPNTVGVKDDASPVTEIDRAVESALRAMIEAEYPDHGIIGEEYGSLCPDAEYVWVIDPIDGTKAFMAGIPVFGTLIAIAHRGVPIVGVMDQPISGERWIGADGVPTTLNGRPVRVRSCPDLAEALICTASPEYYEGDERGAFDRLIGAVKWAVYGGSCYVYGLLAAGSLDIGIEAGHESFDYCALVPIVQNAGGVITDWEGASLTIRSGTRFIAAGDPRAHAQALRLLAGE